MKTIHSPDFVRRAISAYMRSDDLGYGVPYPANDSSLETWKDKHYVVLRNTNGILAVYRVTNRDILKRMKRWPKEIVQVGEAYSG